MKIRFVYVVSLLLISLPFCRQSLRNDNSNKYHKPTDKNVLLKLESWQDKKFGFIIHWGLYSVPGVCESWTICSEDADWIPRDSTVAYTDYKKAYFDYSKEFAPEMFNPDDWAEMAANAGMNYLVFTTKHHEGFCMFDSKYTDFSIAQGPFKDNPLADVTKHVFDSFRKKDFMIGAYFPKPDRHTQYNGWDRYATPTRNQNYEIKNHPYRWEFFKEFTFNQMEELMTRYGDIDILWLDGGWVSFYDEGEQTINMDSIAKMARKHQPGVIIVDRWINGPHENYLTPEQNIPKKQMLEPWETCLALGRDWGYVGDNYFKSSKEIIHTLVEVVAKGGSLLLGAGPDGRGVFPDEVKDRLAEIGEWMKVNGESIYGTRPIKHYQDANVWFVKSKDGDTIYATCLLKNEDDSLPDTIEWKGNIPSKESEMRCLQTGEIVKWSVKGGKVKVYISESIKKSKTPAVVFAYN